MHSCAVYAFLSWTALGSIGVEKEKYMGREKNIGARTVQHSSMGSPGEDTSCLGSAKQDINP